jgi:hypothetical protein
MVVLSTCLLLSIHYYYQRSGPRSSLDSPLSDLTQRCSKICSDLIRELEFVQHAQDEVLCVVGQAAVEKGRQVVDGRLAVADPPCGLFAHSKRQRCEQKDAEEAPPARCPSASSTCTSSGSNRGSQSVGRS